MVGVNVFVGGASVAVTEGVTVIVGVLVGVRVGLGDGLGLPPDRVPAGVVTVAVGVGVTTAALVAELCAITVSANAVAIMGNSSVGSIAASSSELPAFSIIACSVAAIAASICSGDIFAPAAEATSVESASTVAFQSTIGLGVTITSPPSSGVPGPKARLVNHMTSSRASAPINKVSLMYRRLGRVLIGAPNCVLSTDSSSPGTNSCVSSSALRAPGLSALASGS